MDSLSHSPFSEQSLRYLRRIFNDVGEFQLDFKNSLLYGANVAPAIMQGKSDDKHFDRRRFHMKIKSLAAGIEIL